MPPDEIRKGVRGAKPGVPHIRRRQRNESENDINSDTNMSESSSGVYEMSTQSVESVEDGVQTEVRSPMETARDSPSDGAAAHESTQKTGQQRRTPSTSQGKRLRPICPKGAWKKATVQALGRDTIKVTEVLESTANSLPAFGHGQLPVVDNRISEQKTDGHDLNNNSTIVASSIPCFVESSEMD